MLGLSLNRASALAFAVCAVAVPSLAAQISDTTPPVLVSLAFSATTLDTTTGSATLTVTAHITDDLSGYNPSDIGNFISPGGTQSRTVFFSRQSGTATDGVYKATVIFPRYSEAGAWQLTEWLVDNVGNSRTLTPANLASAGLPNSVTLVSVSDLTPPVISSLVFSPATADVSNGPQTITVRLGVTDNLSGANFSQDCYFVGDFVVAASPSGTRRRILTHFDFQLASGTALNGVWQASFVMPQYSEAGPWAVQSVRLEDNVGNQATVTGAQLTAAGINPNFMVVSSQSDLTPPTLTSLTLSPTFVDTSLGPQTISVLTQVADNLSGASFTGYPATSCTTRYGVALQSPSGAQHAYEATGTFPIWATLAGGTPLNGMWQGTLTMPQFSEAGTWTVTAVSLRDTVLNLANYSTAQLTAMGFPTQVQVIQPSGTIDGTLGSGGGTVTDQVFGSSAQLIVPANAFGQNTSVAIDVLQSPPTVPMPEGFSAPGSYYVNIALTPHPSGLLPPPGATLTIPLANTLPTGTVLVLYKINSGTNPPTLSPEPSVTGGFVQGTVNAGGLSATFTGIASFSTVVGLISTGQAPGDVNNDGKVNCLDVSIVKASFGKRKGQTGFDQRADINGDGVVDINDLSFVLKQLPSGTVCQ